MKRLCAAALGILASLALFSAALADGISRSGYETMRDAQYQDLWGSIASQEIRDRYGERVVIKPKSLHKFGRTTNADTGVSTTVMGLAGAEVNETYVTTNVIDSVSSSDNSDTQLLSVECHTVSGTGADSAFTFVTQQVTLTGQTRAALATPCARVSRLANLGSTEFAGTVYVFQNGALTAGVPDDATTVHLTATPAAQQSEKAAITLSQYDYGIITSWTCGINRAASAANADCILEVRSPGGVFREQDQIEIRSDGVPDHTHHFRPFLIVAKNSDVRVTVTSTANNTTITAGFSAMFGLTDEGITEALQ